MLVSIVNQLSKHQLYRRNVLCVSAMYYASEKKKNPHIAKKKEAWVKTNTSSKDNKIKAITKLKKEENILNHEVVDDVWLVKEYAPQNLDLETIVNYHKELAQECMFNNMNGYVTAKLTLDMKTKKKGKFLDNVKLNVKYPYDFDDGIKKEVIAVCKNEKEILSAKEAGALYAGYSDILKMFERGDITDASYDFLVCTSETLADVNLIKKKINKDRLPTLKSKTVGDNIYDLVSFFRFSKGYDSLKVNDEISILKANIGTLNMDYEKIDKNLKELLKTALLQEKKIDTDIFIKNCTIYCAPSTEWFSLNINNYINEIGKMNDNEEVKAN